MNDIDQQLMMVLTASYQGAVGYGHVFDCEVVKVIAGTMDEPRVRLSILASDKDELKFIEQHLHPAEIVVRFALNRKDEPYRLAPISGFVDNARTSWRLEFIREDDI